MTNRTKRWLIPSIGTVIGFIAGYMYYHFIGCATGTCPITSRPLNATLYGGVLGLLISLIFQPDRKKEEE